MQDSNNCGETVKKLERYQSGVFLPFEISFCGYSGAGKTTLIEKIVKSISKKYSIAYLKNDAHGFQMDREGKDTYRLSKAGAKGVFINHLNEYAYLDHRESEKYHKPQLFSEYDMVIVEGFKQLGIPKILVLDSEKVILNEFNNRKYENVIAIVGADMQCEVSLPYFQRDQIEAIEKFILEYFGKIVKSRPLNGLVLTGGKSKRMGTDKAMLNYHGVTQVEHNYTLLKSYCEDVFVSVREKRHNLNLPQITDKYLDIGPMGGILSTMRENPDAAWLVMACDLPFVTRETLEYLIEHRNPFKNATAFASAEDSFPEPLCAIYEPKSVLALMWFLSLGYHCPRKVLINSRVEILELINEYWLVNANSPEEFDLVKAELQKDIK